MPIRADHAARLKSVSAASIALSSTQEEPQKPAGSRNKPKVTPAPSGMMRPELAAAHIGVTSGTMAKWRCAGSGPAFIRAGGRILYREADLDTFLEDGRVKPTSQS